jgi:hypothetical protein
VQSIYGVGKVFAAVFVAEIGEPCPHAIPCIARPSVLQGRLRLSTGETEAPVHGCYRIDAISPDVFDEVTPSHANEVLNTWMDQFGPLDRDGVVGELDEVFELLRRSPLVLQLRNLGKDAQHDWGWVGGGTGFHEYL